MILSAHALDRYRNISIQGNTDPLFFPLPKHTFEFPCTRWTSNIHCPKVGTWSTICRLLKCESCSVKDVNAKLPTSINGKLHSLWHSSSPKRHVHHITSKKRKIELHLKMFHFIVDVRHYIYIISPLIRVCYGEASLWLGKCRIKPKMAFSPTKVILSTLFAKHISFWPRN